MPHNPLALACRALLLAGALATSSAHAAGSLAPPTWGPQIEEDERSDPGSVEAMRFGETRVEVGSSTLQELRKAFGTGRIRFSTDAGGTRTSWLCYTLEAATPRQRVWFSGSSESAVESKGDVVETIVVEALPETQHASTRCPLLPGRFAPLDLCHGATIGADADGIAEPETPLTRQGDLRFEHWHFTNHRWGVEMLWSIRVLDGRIVGMRASEFVRS